jgi:hypothetical protein
MTSGYEIYCFILKYVMELNISLKCHLQKKRKKEIPHKHWYHFIFSVSHKSGAIGELGYLAKYGKM